MRREQLTAALRFVDAIVDRERSECARLSHGTDMVTSELLEAGLALRAAMMDAVVPAPPPRTDTELWEQLDAELERRRSDL